MLVAKQSLPFILGFIAASVIIIASIAGLNLLVYAFQNDNLTEVKTTTSASDLITKADR